MENNRTVFKVIEFGSDSWKEAVLLREDVLRKPLGSFFTEEELAAEEEHIQIAGYIDELLVATGVLVPVGDRLKMQRVAVREGLRGSNIGSEMMIFCERLAQENSVVTIYCHARDSAVDFYLRNGYTQVGEYFAEDGIPHVEMTKQLHIPNQTE